MPPRLTGPKFAAPSWGWSVTPGIDHGPLCTSGAVMTEHTVDWRCARSVAPRCAPGHRRGHDGLGRAGVDDEDVRRGPPRSGPDVERDLTGREHVP